MLKPEEIQQLIDADRASDRKRWARLGQQYYEGKHDILHYRMFYFDKDGEFVEDLTRANQRIPHPYFTELVDQLPAYMLSFEENPIRAKETAEGLQEELDLYFDEEFWSEIYDLIAGASAKGLEYLYAYKDVHDRLAFQCADSLGVVEVRAKDTDDGCEYMIYWYVDRIDKGRTKINRIQVHTADEIWYYVQSEADGKIVLDDSKPYNPQPNVLYRDPKGQLSGASLGFIPFWKLPNGKRQTSNLEPIKAIIDDYDLMQCGLTNNLIDFDHPLYVVKGFEGHDPDELFTNVRTKKTIGTSADGGLEIKTIDIPYEARQAKAAEDEKNIYRFGMGFNSSQAGDGNITNVVIRSRYTLLDLKANKLEKPLKKMLREIVEVVLTEINAVKGTDYQSTDVFFEFERNVPTNEQENVQNDYQRAQTKQLEVNTILNAAAQIGDEATLRALCAVLELEYDDIVAQLEEQAQDTPEAALGALEQVVTTDESEAEADTAALPEA